MLRVSQLHGFNHLKGERDPYWDNVILLMSMDTGFVDLSKIGRAITNSGGTLDSSIKEFGTGKSGYSGTAGAASTYFADDAAIDYGGVYTFEFSIYVDDWISGSFLGYKDIAQGWNMRTNGELYRNLVVTGGTGAGSITKNTWHQIVCCQDTSNNSLYLDGVRVLSATLPSQTGGHYNNFDLFYGTNAGPARNVWLDNIRYTDGVRRYPDAATCPIKTKAFPIL